MRNVHAIVVGALLIAPAAWAQGWQATFTPDAVSSHLAGGQLKVLLAPAGDPQAGSAAATIALSTALQAGGKALFVMGAESLGSLAGADDATIVGKAAGLPVDQVFVVRVFPGAPGAPPSAVVTMYDKSGKLVGAFTGAAGVALAPKAASQPGDGVSAQAATAVSAVTKVATTGNVEAQEEFDKRRVWFQDVTAVHMGTGQVMATWAIPYKGKYKEPLEGAEFYEYVGHPDLASSYRTRSGVRLGFYVGGLLALLGGAGYLLAGLGDPVDTDPDAPSPIEDRLWVSVGLMAGGGLLMAVPAFINPHPVSPVEARKLADEFNTGLKKELGLSARAPAPSREDRAVAVRLSPWTARSAGGLSLSLEF